MSFFKNTYPRFGDFFVEKYKLGKYNKLTGGILMIIVMERGASKDKIEHVLKRLESQGFKIHLSEGVEKTIIGAVGERSYLTKNNLDLEALPGVEKVVPILSKYKLASRDFHSENTIVRVGNLEIGGDKIHIMAGPLCNRRKIRGHGGC
jgi:hypothetical protein